MLESYEQYKHCEKLLKESINAPQDQFFQKQCLLHVVEVRNLPQSFKNPFIKLSLEKEVQGRKVQVEIGQTENQTHENPVYNKRFQFNVGNDSDRVRIFANDSGSVRSKSVELENGILLKDLREYMDDATIEIKELWFDFGN